MALARDYTWIPRALYDSVSMRQTLPSLAGSPIVALVCVMALMGGCLSSAGSVEPRDQAAPDFPTRDPHSWMNSAPLSISDLRGQVVLIDVWTYG
jgi:hypothetical protein